MLEATFEKYGLHEHGYVNDYRSIAEMMLNFFIKSRNGATIEILDKLILNVADAKISIHVDEMLLRDNVRTLRCIFTGHAPNSDPQNIKYAAFTLAAKSAFPDAFVELVYLADKKANCLDIKPKILSNFEDKIREIFTRMRSGDFKTADSAFSCPNCPALLICGSVPTGILTKKFENN